MVPNFKARQVLKWTISNLKSERANYLTEKILPLAEFLRR